MKKNIIVNFKFRFFVLLSFLILIFSFSLVTIVDELRLSSIQKTFIEELIVNEGKYDDSTIVLQDTSLLEAELLAEKFDASLRISYDEKFATLTLSDESSILDLFEQRENRKYINDISLDYYAEISDYNIIDEYTAYGETYSTNYEVDDEYYSYQSYFDYINMEDTWDTVQGDDITVAIIDTGIDTDHIEFSGKISEYSYSVSKDKVVNDYVLDNGDYDWSIIEDEQGHGTAVAGVIGASMNSVGVVGIAPNVELLVIKVDCNSEGSYYNSSDLVYGLYYAIECGADVVNMSFGGYSTSNLFATATSLAVDEDIICVAAAGNDSTDEICYPAADPNVISVGALVENGWDLAYYSNYGDNSDIVAPGTTFTTSLGGGYASVDGTSLASPVVAAAIALYIDYNQYYSFESLKQDLFTSCIDLGSSGNDWYYGYGALDVYSFILAEQIDITFMMMSDDISDVTLSYISGRTLTDYPVPSREYAVFAGWYYDKNCTIEVDINEDIFNEDIILYAGWINEDEGIPYTYIILSTGTIEITGYTGTRSYITVPDTIEGIKVTNIADYAFSGKTNLISVGLPTYLETIGDYAFSNCVNLKDITIPANVKSIGDYAFYNNSNLSNVMFSTGSSLLSIGDSSFSYCSSLTRIDLPQYVSTIGSKVFYGCLSLSQISVDSNNTIYSSSDGVLFDRYQKTIIIYPANRCGDYTIPNTVTAIEEYAFAYSVLTTMIIPDSVEILGEGAFIYNYYMDSITLGSGISYIEDSTFAYNNALTSIIIPNNIKSIGNYAFAENFSLEEVVFEEVSKVLSIGEYAFYKTYSLTHIDLPYNLLSISDFAFSYSGLIELEISQNISTLGSGVFSSCENLSYISVASYNRYFTSVDGVLYSYDLSTIVQYPAGNTQESYTINSSTTTIGAGSFYNVEELSSVNLPNGLTIILEYAFYNCNIENYSLPSSLIYIGQYAFASNNVVTSFAIPASVIVIDDNAFSYDSNIKTITFEQASQLTYIGSNAFEGLASLISINLASLNLEIINSQTFMFCDNLSEVILPTNLESIDSYAFYGCDSLTYISIPSSVEYIGAYAFLTDNGLEVSFESDSIPVLVQDNWNAGVTNYYSYEQTMVSEDWKYIMLDNGEISIVKYTGTLTQIDLSQIDFGASVVEIGEFAFSTSKIETITIPNTVNYIGECAFTGITSLTEIIVEQDNSYYKTVDGVLYNLEMTKLITVPSGMTGTLIISNSIQNLGFGALENSLLDEVLFEEDSNLISIGYRSFYNADSIKTITIPSSVISIDYYAFAMCSNLKTVLFEEDSNLLGVYEGSFYYCEKLQNINLPNSVFEVSNYSFYGCVSLESFPINKDSNLLRIGSYAFAYSSISKLELPTSVIYLGDYSFQNSALKTVSIGSDFEEYLTIGCGVFHNCNSLVEITLPFIGSSYEDLNITWFGYIFGAKNYQTNANYVPESLKVVNIIGGITYIDSYAFYNCCFINEINLSDSIEILGVYAFYNCYDLQEVYFGNSLSDISGAFINCTNLDNINLENNLKFYIEDNIIYSYDKTELLFSYSSDAEIVILNTVETIGNYAFYNCIYIESITVFDGLISVGEYAFYGCENLLKVYNNSAITFDVRGTINGYISYYAEVVVDSSGNEIYYDENEQNSTIKTTDLFEFTYENGVYTLISYFGDSDTVTLPIDIYGIQYEIFQFTGAKNVIIPDSMTSINSYAFSESHILESVIIHNNVTSIGSYAFYNCTSLKSVTIGLGVEYIGECAFSNTYLLNNAVYNNGIFYIDDCIIDVFDSAKEVKIYDTIQAVSIDAFSGASYITSVTVASNNLYILNNIECIDTLIIENMPTHSIYEYFGQDISCIPSSLNNIVVSEGCDVYSYSFQSLEGITIYFDNQESSLFLITLYEDWCNENEFYFSNEWNIVTYYDQNGDILKQDFYRVNEVVKYFYYTIDSIDTHNYILLGWDLDGDGNADELSPTTDVDINAYAVFAEYIVTAPTWTEGGYTEYTNLLTQESYITDYIESLKDSVQYIQSIEATCTSEGNIEYWYLEQEDMYFLDEECTIEISEADTIIEKLAHELTYVSRVESTCTSEGNIEYWYYSVSDKYYSDEEGLNEISETETVIQADGHTLLHVSRVEATCSSEGNIEYWYCIICGKYFSDEEGLNEIDEETTIIEAYGHIESDWIIGATATFFTEGYNYKICEICGSIVEIEYIPMLVDDDFIAAYESMINAVTPEEKYLTIRAFEYYLDIYSTEEMWTYFDGYLTACDNYNSIIESSESDLEVASSIGNNIISIISTVSSICLLSSVAFVLRVKRGGYL